MEVIIFLIIMSIFSALTNKNKKINPRTGRPGTPTSPRPPMQTRSMQQARPLQRPSSPGGENLQGSLGSLMRMLSGEDQVQQQKMAREKQEQASREQAAREEMRRRKEEEDARIEAERSARSTGDPNEIGDLKELEDMITDEQMDREAAQDSIAPMWNLSEATKGIIWHEILEGPKFKTRGQGNRRI